MVTVFRIFKLGVAITKFCPQQNERKYVTLVLLKPITWTNLAERRRATGAAARETDDTFSTAVNVISTHIYIHAIQIIRLYSSYISLNKFFIK